MPPYQQVSPKVITESLAIPMGWLTGIWGNNKFGINPDVDTASAEDLWAGGGDYTGFPTETETVDVVSNNAADTAAGTGARTVRLVGLDENFNEQTEDVTLNGVTPVTSLSTWSRVPRGYVMTAGSGAANAGTITIRHTVTSANVLAVILPGDNQTLIACDTVPAGTKMIIRNIGIQIGSNLASGAADVSLRTRETGGVFRKRRRYTASAGAPVDRRYEQGLVLPALTDVKLRVESVSNNNTSISGEFEYLLYPG